MAHVKLDRKKLQISGIPEPYWYYDVASWPGDEDQLDDLKLLAPVYSTPMKLRHSGVAFIGPSRTGKTFFMTFLMKLAMANGNQSTYTRADYLDGLFFAKSVEQRNDFDRYSEFEGILGIDNLDDHQNPTFCAKLAQFLDYRADNLFPTLICLGCNPEDLHTRFKDELVDKINSKLTVVTC